MMASLIEDLGPNTLWVFLGLTCILGGAAAWASGRAVALTWRPFWMAPAYALALAAAVRFLHYALFEEPLLSAPLFAADFLILVAVTSASFKAKRAAQMRTQYGFTAS